MALSEIAPSKTATRLWDDLREEGEQCELNRVAQLMRVERIQVFPARKRIAASHQAFGHREPSGTGGVSYQQAEI
jgi:hypothetical protein